MPPSVVAMDRRRDASSSPVVFDAERGGVWTANGDAGSVSYVDVDARRVVQEIAIGKDVRSVALSPDAVPSNITLQVEAVRPDGSRAPMLRLNTRADWDRRYWFARPLALPRGTKIEVTANFEDPDILSSAFAVAPPTAPKPPPATMRLTLNVLPANAKPVAP